MKTLLLAGAAVFVSFVAAAGGPLLAELLIGLAFVVVFVGYSSRHPGFAVVGLVIFMPLQSTVLAYLYHHGLPAKAAKDLGYLRQLWAIGLAVTVVRSGKLHRVVLDAVDWFVALYVGVTVVYLILPIQESGTLSANPFSVRLNAWQLDALPMVIFFCVRRLSFSDELVRRIRVAVFTVAIVIGGCAIWESVNKTGFNNFLVKTLDYPAYLRGVLHIPVADPTNLLLSSTGSNGIAYDRAGSLFNNPLILGFFMLIPFGLALERLAGRRMWLLAGIAGGAAMYGLFLSVTRAAMVGAALAVVLAVSFRASRASPHRLRLFVAMIATVALLLPIAGQSSTAARFKALFTHSGQDIDTKQHVDATKAAFDVAVKHPFGLGLGSNSATGSRFSSRTVITAENSYLETADELGVFPAVFFVGALLMLLRRLRRRSRGIGEAATLAGGVWLAGWALGISAFFLEPWYQPIVTFVFFTLAGVALADRSDVDVVPTVDFDAEARELMMAAAV